MTYDKHPPPLQAPFRTHDALHRPRSLVASERAERFRSTAGAARLDRTQSGTGRRLGPLKYNPQLCTAVCWAPCMTAPSPPCMVPTTTAPRSAAPSGEPTNTPPRSQHVSPSWTLSIRARWGGRKRFNRLVLEPPIPRTTWRLGPAVDVRLSHLTGAARVWTASNPWSYASRELFAREAFHVSCALVSLQSGVRYPLSSDVLRKVALYPNAPPCN